MILLLLLLLIIIIMIIIVIIIIIIVAALRQGEPAQAKPSERQGPVGDEGKLV